MSRRTCQRRRQSPTASSDDLESLEETIDLLLTSGALDAVREGAAEFAAGKRVALEEISSEFGGG